MGSRQSSNFDGVPPQYDEEDPPPPYSLAVDETRPSLQDMGNPERSTSRLHPSGPETQDAAAATSLPTSTDPQEASENLNLQRALRGLQRYLQDNTDDWHRVRGAIFRIHDRMVLAELQLAQLRREREVAAHIRSSLESRLHITQARLTAADIRAVTAEDRMRALRREGRRNK